MLCHRHRHRPPSRPASLISITLVALVLLSVLVVAAAVPPHIAAQQQQRQQHKHSDSHRPHHSHTPAPSPAAPPANHDAHSLPHSHADPKAGVINAEIKPSGEIEGLDVETLREVINDAQQQMRAHATDDLTINGHHVDIENDDVTEFHADSSAINDSLIIEGLLDRAVTIIDSDTSTDADIAEAIALLTQASALGSDEAHNELGKIYLFSSMIDKNFTLAHYHFLKAADTGNPAAQHFLSFMYNFHLVDASGELDAGKSVLYDYFASLGDDRGAKISLGYRHLFGYSAPKNCESALSYYRDAAQAVVNELALQPHHQVLTIDRAHLLDEASRHQSINEDSAEVLQYYQHSAESGNIEAQVALGQLHYYGHRGLPHSPTLAAKYFTQAAAAGDSTAMTSLGQMHLAGLMNDSDNDSKKDSNSTAYELFLQAAHLGNAAAQTSLGLIYMQGLITSIPIDYAEAHRWFMSAAAMRNSEAQFQLGVIYFTGLGVKQDSGKAFQFFSIASMSGHTRALFNVGQMLSHGLGTMRSCSDAVLKLKLVSERGDESAILSEGHEAFLAGDYDTSFLLYALAAHEGMETGQANAAFLIDRGYVDLWSNNRHNGSGRSSDSDNDGVKRIERHKHDIAYEMYRLSADQMNVDSMRMIGDYAFYGLIQAASTDAAGVNTDLGTDSHNASYALAAQHYTRAGESGSAQAFFNLGYLYHQGLGVKRDLLLAKRYYDQAISVDPHAYVPCKIALAKLAFDQFVDRVIEWWNGKLSTTPAAQTASSHSASSTPSSTTPTSSHPSSLHWTPSSSSSSSSSSMFSSVSSWSCWSWSGWDWYEALEDVMLSVSIVSLAVIIYYRAQRM